MKQHHLSFDELTPLEQCIADKYLFAQMLQGRAPKREDKKREKKAH